MTRDHAERNTVNMLLTARVLEAAAPAKPTQPFMVGVASDALRR
jgi:hypothetical protein